MTAADSFEREYGAIGRLRLRPLRIVEDGPIIQRWVSQPYARYWGMQGQSLEQVIEAYRELTRTDAVYLGFHEDTPAFLVECYRPQQHPVGDHYRAQPGDRGMHVLVAPATAPVRDFTWSVFRLVMALLFDDPETERVVVEPDIRNAKIHALNRRAGFHYQKSIRLPGKIGHLAFCTRAQHQAALAGITAAPPQASPIAHLEPAVWSAVNRKLIRKAIAELAHERVLRPERVTSLGSESEYRLATDRPHTWYRFRARVLALEHWQVDADSIARYVSGESSALDAREFILDLTEQLGVSAAVLPVYLEELASTLFAAAYKHAHQVWSAADLVHADFQDIESAMTDGHPVFVANSGRVGFDASDYLAYAPETGAPVRLVWLAAHRRCSEWNGARDVAYRQLMQRELGVDALAAFEQHLRALTLDPDDYLFIPVHPWQWFNKLAIVFAPDIATRDLVCLGYGPDRYQAQQSIRTFFNLDHPHKHYVKTALSVLNMGFMRGLSADYMRETPAINDWIHALIMDDAYFAEHGFAILREVASVGYRNPRFDAAVAKDSPYRKMLAALWRESPIPGLAAGQRLTTMAALLHRDRDGSALLPQLIDASGIGIDAWLDRYLDCYLAPLLHCFYRYDLAFMPHGENVILVLENNVPVRALMKDIGEEAAIMNPARELPRAVRRLGIALPADLQVLSIFTDVFDGVLRFLSPILLEQAAYPEARFWERVAGCVDAYGRARPELREKMAQHDLFAPEFRHSCLNRLQLRNNQRMVDLTDPAASLQLAGSLQNPIAKP